MKILILGAGIAGLTSAYVLGSRGHEVTVLDQGVGPARETSFANGGQLSYSHAQPWANPGVLPKLPKWLFHEDSPLVFRFSTDPQMIKWGMRFLLNCTQGLSDRHTRIMFRLGAYSRAKLNEIRDATQAEFDFLQKGILHIFSTQEEIDAARIHHRLQLELGSDERIVSREECLALEPALAQASKPMIGGVYAPSDESGDVYKFCCGLADYCLQRLGTEFVYHAQILRLKEAGQRLKAVATTKGDFAADAYILAVGSTAPLLVRHLGIKLPVYPMKGYSITVPAWEGAPELSITDEAKKIVFSRLGNRIRAAGTAEFAGYDNQLRESRIEPIVRALKALFPAADSSNVDKWACLRPQTPDGPPIIGRTKVENLFLHTGHGTLGWTQGAGTAHLLADIIEQRPTDIPLEGLELHRYG